VSTCSRSRRGSLDPEAGEIERLLIAARRNLRDSRVTSISPETRFDAAYKAIMQSALAALMMHGYRPDTNQPGHHMTVIQTLPLTVGLDAKRTLVLDTLRRQRTLRTTRAIDGRQLSGSAVAPSREYVMKMLHYSGCSTTRRYAILRWIHQSDVWRRQL
jgi:hypothetical protein